MKSDYVLREKETELFYMIQMKDITEPVLSSERMSWCSYDYRVETLYLTSSGQDTPHADTKQEGLAAIYRVTWI